MRPALPLAALLLAGCLAVPPAPVPPERPVFLPPVPVSAEWPGSEPVLALAPDGTLYLEGIGRAAAPPAAVEGNVNKVWRSLDEGATWDDITPPAFGQERSNDGFVAVDPASGAVWAANVFSLTFQVYRSQDRGDTWERVPLPPVPALMHRHWILPLDGTVHVAVEALPPSFATFLGGVPPPVAQTGNPNEGLWYLRSEDDGATWTTPAQIDPRVNFAGQSRMVVSEDGQRLYVARYTEDDDPVAYTYDDGTFYLLASEDGGVTWERREMFPLPAEMSTAVPGLALDRFGRMTFSTSFLADETSRVHLAHSNDGGRNWTPLAPLSPANTSAAMVFHEAGPGDELSFLWYVAQEPGNARELDTSWHVAFARLLTSYPEGQRVRIAGPPMTLVDVTPAPVHEGNICARGPACRAGEDRRLLDYPWMVVAPDGKAHLAFASTAWDRPSAFAVYAREAP